MDAIHDTEEAQGDDEATGEMPIALCLAFVCRKSLRKKKKKLSQATCPSAEREKEKGRKKGKRNHVRKMKMPFPHQELPLQLVKVAAFTSIVLDEEASGVGILAPNFQSKAHHRPVKTSGFSSLSESGLAQLENKSNHIKMWAEIKIKKINQLRFIVRKNVMLQRRE